MSLEQIERNIARLIMIRRSADYATQKVINTQLAKLYEFKYFMLEV